MNRIKNIKELLDINLELLYGKSVFLTDLISKEGDSRSFLLFGLDPTYKGIFSEFQVSIFNGVAHHLELHVAKHNFDEFKSILEQIISEYGDDENEQGINDIESFEYMSWWFKNDKHEKTYDDPFNDEETYYGIMINKDANKITLGLIDYSNIDIKLNSLNWSRKQREVN
ncbi:hypothetical protein [Winogradskyella sp. 3972H.M.0a.05]|uniref:hypothetical protein n=1 Tax=Winogradskyella sp. 3972H.M.0a.05 TaxID=2950277 RepID=UPI0033961779